MHIAVLCDENIAYLPPVLSLLAGLNRLGQEVTLITRDASCLADEQLGTGDLHIQEYGVWGAQGYLKGVKNVLDSQRFVRSYLREHRGAFDVVWAASDMSARMAGKELAAFRYVIQLHELVEHVPLATRHKMPLESKELIKLARSAWKVVVPEYNRAYIQASYWDLPAIPFVLPNKPAYAQPESGELPEEYRAAYDAIAGEECSVLLYQGAFGNDRDLEPYARALEQLDDRYMLYLMGPDVGEENHRNIERVRAYPHVRYLGYVKPPHHLSFTAHADIGLMPYAPTALSYYSKLNALYCAPNKIWEYTQHGVPILATDVPGIHQVFASEKIGLTIADTELATICDALTTIEARYDEMSANAQRYYASIDYDQLLAQVLEL